MQGPGRVEEASALTRQKDTPSPERETVSGWIREEPN